jgi:hypothetical protein
MSYKKRDTLLVGSLFLLLLFTAACASESVAPVTAEPAPEVAQKQVEKQEAVAPKPEPPKPATPYSEEIKPLSTSECGRCHLAIYKTIKDEGGKHKFDCTKCHTTYHGYNPVKQNWNAIMPKCRTCHGLIHGDKFATCSTCHTNPHAPKTRMAMSPEFAKLCAACHTKESQVLQQNPSKHTQVACALCHHDKHGYIPSCMECHKPHSAGQTVKDCLACHPAHEPLKITYPDTTKNEVCAACHAQEYNKISHTKSRHGQVACAKCHTRHKYIPKCQECHGQPHGEVVLKKFPNCLQCHIDVHDLPAKGGK